MFNLRKINIHYGYIIVACCCLINVGLTISCAGIFYGPVSADLGTTVGKLGIYISLLHLFSTLSIIEKYSICAKRKDTRYIKNLYEYVKALPNKYINIVAYSVKDLLPDTKMLELFDNQIKTGKVSLHFCRENLIYNSQTPASEFVRLRAVVLFSQYHNIKSIPKENLQSLANEMYIRQMQENIKANILKNQ